ncbi:hypothetical protein [Parasitella parasitica]|uniref:Extracellular membrane protein CFEM domain-containing protein n=1 Tax=Parasitella parasitica TaxID=35722 RepID=A0A0B7N620_9FUNG|nr:hypothetical protein [Parasitella parasitica]
MRSSLTIAAVAAVAVVAVAVYAEDCNPSYDVPTSGTCFTNCNINAGNTFLSGWTMDHTSPNFITSLSLMCNKGTSEYLAFMSKAGMCMAGCPDDPELFNSEFAGACAWWAIHKNDSCGGSSASTSNTTISSNSSTAAAVTRSSSTATGDVDADKAASTSAASQITANLQKLALAMAAGAAYFIL